MPGIKKFKMNNDNEFEESPLLAREHHSDKQEENTLGSLTPLDETSANGKLHPERFDMTRFSERQDEEESSFRIVIYIVIVILIGIGLAFGARLFITKQSDSGDTTETETEEPTNSAVTISTNAISDELAENAPTNDDLGDSALTSVGSADVVSSNLEVDKFIYDKYETFARNIFSLKTKDGATSDFPRVNIEFTSESNTLKVIFPEDTDVNADLKEPIGINDVVTEISYSAGDNSFLIVLSEDSKYRVWTKDLDLIIDVRTVEAIEEIDSAPAEETTTEEETVTPEEETPEEVVTPSGTTNLTNDFSTSKQSVKSQVTGNTIGHNEFFYGDTVDYFEFAWGSRNNVGNEFVPNATAELVKEGGKVYIDITVNNLSSEAFEQYGISGTALTTGGINLAAANFVRVDRTSFVNGTAKYRVEIKREASFRLSSEPTASGATQVLSIQIKDQ